MKSRTCFGCLAALIALGAVAGFFAWRALSPPQVGSTKPFNQVSPQEQQKRRDDVSKLKDQVRDLAASARRKEHKPFTLTATEEQLNTLLQDSLRTEKFAVRDLAVGLEPDQLAIQGKVLYNGFDAVATLTGNVVAREGKLAYQVESLHLAGLPAPGNWKDKIETRVTDKLNDLMKDAPGKIEQVKIEKGQMTIQGTTD